MVTEYRQASQTQIQPFHAEIELFNMEEIRRMIHEHLEAYYDYHSKSQGELLGDELEAAELDAGTALKVFQALFADREEFRGQDRAQNFLRNATSLSVSAILTKFVAWIKDLISRVGGERGIVQRSSDTPENLAFELEIFVEMRPIPVDDHGNILEASPSLWPIVKIVRVGLQSHFLSQGLVIADLPGMLPYVGPWGGTNWSIFVLGFFDTNVARVRAAKQYIRECACCVLVAPIARVTTDKTVHHKLMEAFRRPGVGKMLVTTKIDVSLTYKPPSQLVLTRQDLSPRTSPQKLEATPQSIEEFTRLSDAQSLAARELKGLESSVRKLKGEARTEVEEKRAILALVRIPRLGQLLC